MKTIYVAHPYRARTTLGVLLNIWRAIKFGRYLKKLNYCPIIPHINSWATIAFYGDDTKITEYDMELLKRCDALAVCGERVSAGMKKEVEFAEDNDMLIVYINRI